MWEETRLDHAINSAVSSTKSPVRCTNFKKKKNNKKIYAVL